MNAGIRLEARRRDGTHLPVEISLTPVQTESGMLVRAVIQPR
jgi:hypothetical protein